MCDAHIEHQCTRDETIASVIECFKFQLSRYLDGRDQTNIYFLRNAKSVMFIYNICKPIIEYAKREIEKLKVICEHQTKSWCGSSVQECDKCKEHNDFLVNRSYNIYKYVNTKITHDDCRKLFDDIKDDVVKIINKVLCKFELYDLTYNIENEKYDGHYILAFNITKKN